MYSEEAHTICCHFPTPGDQVLLSHLSVQEGFPSLSYPLQYKVPFPSTIRMALDP